MPELAAERGSCACFDAAERCAYLPALLNRAIAKAAPKAAIPSARLALCSTGADLPTTLEAPKKLTAIRPISARPTLSAARKAGYREAYSAPVGDRSGN